MTNNKHRLFELMEKVNPNFKNEDVLQKTTEPVPTDVANLEKAVKSSSSVQYADSRIDTPKEFEFAFKDWLSGTGFHPQKNPISISQAQSFVKNAMESLGYK